MIVITTPTGQIGRQVLGNLLDSGEQLRVIARDPSQRLAADRVINTRTAADLAAWSGR